MKRSELIFSALLVPLDYCMVFLAGLLAYHLRFGQFVQGLRPVFYDIVLSEYLSIVAVVAAIFLFTFALTGLYAIRSTRGFASEMGKIFVGCSAAMTIVIVVVFFQREVFSSRFIVLFGWILSFFLVIAERGIVRWIQHALLSKGVGVRSVAVIGDDPLIQELASELHKHLQYGFRVEARYQSFSDDTKTELARKAQSSLIDELIIGQRGLADEDITSIKTFADEYHLGFRYVAGLFEVQSPHMHLATVSGIPVVEILKTRLDGWGKIWKRTFDLVVALVLMLVLIPVFLVVSLLVVVDSSGPVFVRLDRVGEKGKTFRLYKFRSMVKNALTLKEELVKFNQRSDGPLFKIKDDPRITRVGRFLRKLSIDELPQLWNVVVGDMSLIGPRPHEPEEIQKYELWHKRVLTIKPGMTGLAQISGRSELRFDEEARLDLYYIENWSIGLDVRILAKTPFVVLAAKTSS